MLAIANDPAATYNTNEPQGIAVLAPPPDQLKEVFQALASKILTSLPP
jgi:hypothetical protein